MPLSAESAAGGTVLFGSYEQDNDTSDGKEPIEWIVLENDGETVTLLSLYGLDSQPFHFKAAGISWETSSIRQWMNEDFLNEAFSDEERTQLETVTVTAEPNPEFDIDPGNDTQDKVWFLSVQEADRYFTSDDERICTPTAYAVARGVYTDDSGACWWWLRTRAGSLHIRPASVVTAPSITKEAGRTSAIMRSVRWSPSVYLNDLQICF